MPESFGARLRRQRERRQVSLTAIAEQTKIKQSLLEGLERDEVVHWPTGIFRRAFIRAYAHAIGLEPDIVVREFLSLYPDPTETVDPIVPLVVAQSGDGSAARSGPPSRWRYLAASAMESLSRMRNREVHDQPTVTTPPPPVLIRAEEPDFSAAARLCTRFAQLDDLADAASPLQEAAGLVDAVGLIVWVWDSSRGELRPMLAHGYSDKVVAQLPRVRRDTDNATANAFRSAQPCVVRSNGEDSGALAVPLMTGAGCVGVLAIELPAGSEQRESVRAVLLIVAALLARLAATVQLAETADRKLA